MIRKKKKPIAPHAEAEARKEKKKREIEERAKRMNSKIQQRKRDLGEA